MLQDREVVTAVIAPLWYESYAFYEVALVVTWRHVELH